MRHCLVLSVVEYLSLVVATVRWQARLIRLLVVNILLTPAPAAWFRIRMQFLLLRLIRFPTSLECGLRLTVMKMFAILSASRVLAIWPSKWILDIPRLLSILMILEPYMMLTPGLPRVCLVTTWSVWNLLWWRTTAIPLVKWARNAVLLTVELLLLMMVTRRLWKKNLL